MREPHFHLPASNEIHFFAPGLSTKEKKTWIYSIVLLATIPGTRGVCWNTRVL
jgi:hypothetical protein